MCPSTLTLRCPAAGYVALASGRARASDVRALQVSRTLVGVKVVARMRLHVGENAMCAGARIMCALPLRWHRPGSRVRK